MGNETKIEALPSGNVFSLQQAILLYGKPQSGYSSKGELVYASLHDVDCSSGKPSIGAGKPVSKAGLRKMMATLEPTKLVRPEFLGGNMLAVAPKVMVWWTPPSSRGLFFNCEEFGGQVSATVPLPGLVFAVIYGAWYVFALAGKDRPTPETPLMRAPFFNVWAGGDICTGNVERPRGKKYSDPLEWEFKFFNSWFTHSNIRAPDKLLEHKKGAYGFWKEMLDGKFKQFPVKALVNESWQGKPVHLADLIAAAGRKVV